MRHFAALLLLITTVLSAAIPSRSSAVLQPPEPSASSGGDDRYGINFVNSDAVMKDPNSSPYISLRYQEAASAGAKWTRWPMYWNEIQPYQNQPPDYSAQDAVVDLDHANGLQIDAILMYTPDWAAISGSPTAPYPRVGDRSFRPLVTDSGVQLSTAQAPPRNLYLPWNDPSNYWGKFVHDTVLRYKDRGVKIWEIWNEPDGKSLVFWTGTPADYYQLLKVGYQAVKDADPQATVLFGGLAYWGNENFFPSVLQVAASDPAGPSAGYFFDALPWHPYIDPYYIYDWAQRARSQMQARGFTKPIWVNETNIPVCGKWPTSCSPGDTWRASLDEQASYVIQAYAYAFAADVQRLSIFQLWDDGLVQYSDYYGLITNDPTARPSYTAYGVASTYLARPSKVTRTPGSNYEMIVFEGTPQGRVTVVWATQGSPVQVNIPASSVSARLVDQAGNVSNVAPSGGYYRVTVPGVTNNRGFIQGGKPYLLVESTAPPVSIGGRVTDNRGISILGAVVTASAGWATYTAATDGSGNYSLRVPPGTYDLVAGLSGYGAIPSRRLNVTASLTYNFVLPPLNNGVQNWGFEGNGGATEWWSASGQISTSTDQMHTGIKAAKLGESGIQNDATLSQSGIPLVANTYKPTLSFMYYVPSPPGAGDTFYLDVTSSGGTSSYPIALNAQGGWAQKWLALGDVSGPVTLSFRLHKASANQLRVFLDEVSLGKASGGTNVLRFPTVYKN